MRSNDGWVGGLVLIAIGIALLLGQLTDEMGRYILLGLGVVLLVIWAISRNPGTLIGGGIVTGLGVGVAVGPLLSDELAGAAVLFGLGGGFLFVGLMGELFHQPEARFWPFIPGTILVIVGGVVLAGSEAAELAGYVWPIVIIGLGVIVLAAAFLRRSGPDEPDAVEPAAEPSPPDQPMPG